MRSLIAVIAVLVLGVLICSSFGGDGSQKLMQGELRCEGAGGVIINVDGKDYAVNGMAGSRYAPIQAVWKSAKDPDIDAGPIISRGLTLCQW
jgi:hypothetical protein